MKHKALPEKKNIPIGVVLPAVKLSRESLGVHWTLLVPTSSWESLTSQQLPVMCGCERERDSVKLENGLIV